MTADERKRTLRRLLGRYLSEPDPDGWRVAADLIEESCGGTACCADEPCAARARRWRARGVWLIPILDAFGAQVAGRGWVAHEGSRRLTFGPLVWIGFHRFPKTTRVCVHDFRTKIGGEVIDTAVWLNASAFGLRPYHVRRAIELIDANLELFAAHTPE